MQLADELIKAIENQIGVDLRSGHIDWNSDVKALLNSIKDMEEDAAFLGCLNAAGVEDWEGYPEAQELFDEEN